MGKKKISNKRNKAASEREKVRSKENKLEVKKELPNEKIINSVNNKPKKGSHY